MRIGERLDRFLAGLEWRWSLGQFALAAYFVASTALPAWAVSAMESFNQYAPLSWVIAGFVGLASGAIIYAIVAFAYGRFVRSRYNSQLLAKSGFVDPMAKTFENRRIFLNEFCLPSDLHVEGKAFINCELIGPANIIIRSNNQLADQRLPHCDAVLTRTDTAPYNGIYMDNCTFRGCSFKRITIIVPQIAYEYFAPLDWLHWLNLHDKQPDIPGMIDEQPNPSEVTGTLPPPDTPEDTPR